MTLIALTSASGSPGVTTTALGLALAWPRPVVLVEADPTGASAIAAGYMRGSILPDRTIVDLAMSHRQGSLAEDLPRILIPLPDSQVKLLHGPLRHTQARSLDSVWESLAGALKALERTGQDVIVDAGRLGVEGAPTKLLTAADLTLLTTRTTLPALIGAKSWASTLHEAMHRAGATDTLGLALIGPGRPYGAKEARKVLNLPVVTSLPWDPTSAEVLSTGADPDRAVNTSIWGRLLATVGAGRRFDAAPLPKALRATVQEMRSRITAAREDLDLAQEAAR